MSVSWPASFPAQLHDPELEQEVDDLLNGMSLEQKVGQMIQPDIRYISPAQVGEYYIGSVLSGGGAPPGENLRAEISDWVGLADEFYDAALQSGVPVPPCWGIDALHGHNNLFGATLFPHNIGLGASRNVEVAREIARATAVEVAVTGLEWTFAPTLAVALDDRWGRTYESFSECTALVDEFTAPTVEGLQGALSDENFLQRPNVIATAKHYMADGGTFDGVDQGDTQCDETTLFKVHGKPYLSALRAGVQVVMASFSSWNGQKMHGHHYLLQQVLKDQMGFDGFVISDWNGHGQLTKMSNEHAEEAVCAGIDMLMAPEDWQGLWHNTIDHVNDGSIPLVRIDDAVRRILRVKLRAGLRFPCRPSEREMAGRADLVGCEAHRDIARRAVRESAVLLKNNDQVLPLKPGSKVLVCGPGADNIPMQAGGWSLSWQGDSTSNDFYPGGTSILTAVQGAITDQVGNAEVITDLDRASECEVAVVVYGEMPYAEGYGDREHLSFSSTQPEGLGLLRTLRGAGLKTVSVLLTGRPLWVNPELNASDAFVVAWLPGTEAAGLADVMFAREGCDFQGRLSFSWPKLPTQTSPHTGDALFGFGYGLSYVSSEQFPDDLDEKDSTLIEAPDGELDIFDLRPVPPFKLYAGDEADWRAPVSGKRFLSKNGVVEVTTTDWQRQEDARRVRFFGGSGQIYFLSDKTIDCTRLIVPGAVLEFTLCVHSHPEGQVVLRQDSIYPHVAAQDITSSLRDLPLGVWRTLDIGLDNLVPEGLQPARITTPFLLWTDGEFELSIGAIRIESHGDPAAVEVAGGLQRQTHHRIRS